MRFSKNNHTLISRSFLYTLTASKYVSNRFISSASSSFWNTGGAILKIFAGVFCSVFSVLSQGFPGKPGNPSNPVLPGAPWSPGIPRFNKFNLEVVHFQQQDQTQFWFQKALRAKFTFCMFLNNKI